MNFFQLISIEILVAYALICGIIMYNKPIVKSAVILLTAPISFISTALILSTGVFKFAGDLVIDFVSGSVLPAEFGGKFTDSLSIASSFVTAFVNLVLFAILFWLVEILLLVIVKIVFAIINKSKKKKLSKAEKASAEKKEAEEKSEDVSGEAIADDAGTLGEPVALTEEKVVENKKDGKKTGVVVLRKLSTAAMGAVFGMLLCIFSFYPITSIFGLVLPAFDRAQDADHINSQVGDIAKSLDEDIVGDVEESLFVAIDNVQPFKSLYRYTDSLIADVTLTKSNGQTIRFNVFDTVSSVVCYAVDGLAVYEYAMVSDEHSISELGLVCEVLSDLAERPELLTVAVEYIDTMDDGKTSPETEEEQSISDMFMELLLSEYSDGNADALSNDIHVVSNVLALLLADSENVMVDGAVDYAYGFMTDKDKMTGVITELSKFNSYGSVITTMTEYVVNILCDKLEIYESEDVFKQEFLNKLSGVIYDGKAQISNLEEFVDYSVQNKYPVMDHVISNSEMPSTLDISFTHCKEYINDYKSAVALFKEYYINCPDDVYYYNEESGVVYKYTGSVGYWVVSEEKIPGVALVIICINDWYATLPEVITHEEMLAMFGGITESFLSDRFPGIDAEQRKEAALFASSVTTIFERNMGIVVKEEIVNALNKEITPEQLTEQSDVFAELMMNVGVLLKVNGEDGLGVNTVLSNFGDIGAILDVLCKLDYTKDLPDELLLSIAQNKNYRQYFDIASIETMIDNIKNDKSSYENIFTSIQALYQIANEIM